MWAAQQAIIEDKRVQVVTYRFSFHSHFPGCHHHCISVVELENGPPISLFFCICAGIASVSVIVPLRTEFRGTFSWTWFLQILPSFFYLYFHPRNLVHITSAAWRYKRDYHVRFWNVNTYV